jgi:NAD(P)H dehydrogenase (quinone)
MAKAIVIYYSRGGNTSKMAELISDAVRQEGIETVVKDVVKVKADELLEYDGIIVGSPTYYGTMAAELKKMFDDSVKFHGKLDGKVGAAFSTSANLAGGNETTILDILNAMLIHGMIIQGDPKGSHYGAVSVNAPDERAKNECLRWGKRIAKLIKKCI